ncbi:hypothetical protein KSF73_06915 [Burkholderiaceae bacterium DAT-1]|nr:hypothetical protein [Burkholderiaceae bacterium DAT-1]
MSKVFEVVKSGFPLVLFAWLALCATSVAGEMLSRSISSQHKGLSGKTTQAIYQSLRGETVQS